MVTRWGQQWGKGIVFAPTHSLTKPWRVKFRRRDRWIRVGDFPNLRLAQRAAAEFQLKDPPYARL